MKQSAELQRVDPISTVQREESTPWQRRLRVAEVEELFSRTLSGHLGELCLAALMVVVLWEQVSQIRLIAWMACYAVIQAIRLALVATFRRTGPTGEEVISWGRHADLLTTVAGIAWGVVPVLLFPSSSLFHQYMLTLFVLGLGCSSVVVHIPTKATYACANLAMFLPLAGRHLYEGNLLHTGVGLAVLGLALVIFLVGRKLHLANTESLALRFEKDDLINSLHAQKAKLEEANGRLAAEGDKRHQAETALNGSEKVYRTLVETAQDILWMVDMNLRYTYVSPSITSVLGYTVEEIMTMTPLDTLTESSRNRIAQIYAHELGLSGETPKDARTPKPEEIEQYHKDGTTRWMEVTATYIYDSDGNPKGIQGISRDITKRKQLEMMKSDFVTTAAHEFRTPLTSIRGFSELLLIRRDLSQEEQQECLVHIKEQAEKLTYIVDDLLDISRIESGEGFPTDAVLFNINEMIMELISFYRENSEVHRFETKLPEDPAELYADKWRIRKLFDNILDNAVAYSPEGGLISVKAERQEDHYLFSIEDQGIGMSSDQLEKIFDGFYRSDASNTSVSGTGLGMTVVKNVVEVCGGRVWVESKPGQGTKVEFTLPFGFPGV